MLGLFPDFYQRLNVAPVGTEAVPLQMHSLYHSLELISLCSGKYTFSRLIALLDLWKEILPRLVKIWSNALGRLCAF